MTAFMRLLSPGLDVAGVEVMKARAQSTADASPLYAPDGLIGGNVSSIHSRVIPVAADNLINGTSG